MKVYLVYLVYLCVLLIGLSGCAKKNVTSSSTNNSSSEVEATSTKKYIESETLIIRPVVFSKNSYAKDAVRNECKLEEKLTQFIEQSATGQYKKIMTSSKSKSPNAHTLTVEIQHIDGDREKWGYDGRGNNRGGIVGVIGTLTMDGEILASFKALRSTRGGVFGGYKGICSKLSRCVKTLGSDISGWLANPIDNAELGDF